MCYKWKICVRNSLNRSNKYKFSQKKYIFWHFSSKKKVKYNDNLFPKKENSGQLKVKNRGQKYSPMLQTEQGLIKEKMFVRGTITKNNKWRLHDYNRANWIAGLVRHPHMYIGVHIYLSGQPWNVEGKSYKQFHQIKNI